MHVQLEGEPQSSETTSRAHFLRSSLSVISLVLCGSLGLFFIIGPKSWCSVYCVPLYVYHDYACIWAWVVEGLRAKMQ